MESVFHGLAVPDGPERRNLYTSQIRTLWTYKLSLGEMDELLRQHLEAEGWEVLEDHRQGLSGRIDIKKDETMVHVQIDPCSSAAMVALKYFVDY